MKLLKSILPVLSLPHRLPIDMVQKYTHAKSHWAQKGKNSKYDTVD